MRAGVITVSDRCFRGEREDGTGPAVEALLSAEGIAVVRRAVVPDDAGEICRAVTEMAESGSIQLVVLTGGTGIGPRDVTPEAVEKLFDKRLPGFGEAMRMKSLESTPTAILSRAGAGTKGRSLVIYVPGSPRAATECLLSVMGAIVHAVEILGGAVTDCARRLDSPPSGG